MGRPAVKAPLEKLRCWTCRLLRAAEKGVYTCPRNFFHAGERLPAYFAERCPMYEPTEGAVKPEKGNFHGSEEDVL